MDTSLLLKMEGRSEILSSEWESKFPNEANSDMLGFILNSDMMKSNSQQRRTSGSRVRKYVPKSKRARIGQNVPIKTSLINY